jgi:hypothetical protein
MAVETSGARRLASQGLCKDRIVIEPERVEALNSEWQAALADAGFAGRAARLYPFPGEMSADETRAYYFVPGQRIYHDAHFPDELGGQIQDANDHRDRHRIAVWVDGPTPVLGAKLRHELEHARQWDAHGKPLFDLNDLTLAVLAERVGGLPGGGVLYNLIPTETDANAASAAFAWARYGEEVCRPLCDPMSRDGALFRSLTPPPAIETLPTRMLAFLLQFADLCERFAERRERSFTDLLDEAWPGASASWAALQAVTFDPSG